MLTQPVCLTHTLHVYNIKVKFISLTRTLLVVLVCCLSQTSQAADQLRVRFVTFNVDFSNSGAKVRADVEKVEPKADIIMFQEAKNVTIDNYLDSNWTVVQVVDQGDAKRGSAIAIRNSIMIEKQSEGLRFGVDNNGEDMLDRYIAWANVKLTNGQVLRVMSLHMPPQRIQYLQPIMAGNFEAFVESTNKTVIAGGDWNFTVNNDPYDIQPHTGLTPRGMGIDGFYYDAQVIHFQNIYELSGLEVNSDHDPVQLVTDVDGVDSGVNDWQLY